MAIAEASVDITADTEKFERDVRRILRRVERERAEIEVDVDVDDAERDVEGLRRAIDSLGGAAGTAGRIGAIGGGIAVLGDRKSTRLNSSHVASSYAVSCLKKKKRK